jgi:hypothetical protein
MPMVATEQQLRQRQKNLCSVNLAVPHATHENAIVREKFHRQSIARRFFFVASRSAGSIKTK